MFRIPALVLILFLLFLYLRYLRRLPHAQRRRQVAWAAFVGLLLGLLYLTLTGRLHFLVTLGAAVLPLLKQLPTLLRWLSRWRRLAPGRAGGPVGSKLSEVEALRILGLGAGASRQDVIDAHRRLMQKLHPDHGGNDYLAAQLNQARDVLLEGSSGKDSST
jgi:hypothetical protein